MQEFSLKHSFQVEFYDFRQESSFLTLLMVVKRQGAFLTSEKGQGVILTFKKGAGHGALCKMQNMNSSFISGYLYLSTHFLILFNVT